MKDIVLAAALIALAALVCWAVSLRVRSRRYGRLKGLVSRGDREGFVSLRDSNVSRATVSLYARELLTLQLLGRCGTDKEVREQTNTLMRMSLNDSQRSQVLGTAFEILARRGDASHCRRLLEEIERVMSPETARPYRIYFDTVLQGRACHRDELERRLSQLEGAPARKTRGYVEYLLSKCYETTGDAERAEAMRERSAQDYAVEPGELERSVDVASYV